MWLHEKSECMMLTYDEASKLGSLDPDDWEISHAGFHTGLCIKGPLGYATDGLCPEGDKYEWLDYMPKVLAACKALCDKDESCHGVNMHKTKGRCMLMKKAIGAEMVLRDSDSYDYWVSVRDEPVRTSGYNSLCQSADDRIETDDFLKVSYDDPAIPGRPVERYCTTPERLKREMLDAGAGSTSWCNTYGADGCVSKRRMGFMLGIRNEGKPCSAACLEKDLMRAGRGADLIVGG